MSMTATHTAPGGRSAFLLLAGLLALSPLSVRGGDESPTRSAEKGLDEETLPALREGRAPQDLDAMWAGFDARAEPLETEVLAEWEEDGVVLQVLRFRIGIFKGQKAKLAAVYGYPKRATSGAARWPGLVQIHGGGQYADHRACLANARRGYATLSVAWAGRISASKHAVGKKEVRLFIEGQTADPSYKLTTDWGAVDGYHAPSKNPGNVFPSARAAAWTLDAVESPRNSGWFLCAVAARRALTFLEQQPEVDPQRLGVYGHSMGGKLTVLASVDARVRAAAPSCGGISDRQNSSALFRRTLGDDVSLKAISCPIIFLSPANDFHGRIGDLPLAAREIQSDAWRVICSPHHNHQDTAEYEVATLLWFDQHLKGTFTFPRTPEVELNLAGAGGVPEVRVRADPSRPLVAVDVFYTRHGKANEGPEDRESTMHRFWHHERTMERDGDWTANLALSDTDEPLWVYANVTYSLEQSVKGAGYYYGSYTAETFTVSSVLRKVTADDLKAAGVRATRKSSLDIESFEGDWQKEWFSYRPAEWARSTHKLRDKVWRAPAGAQLVLDVRSADANQLVVRVDDYAAAVSLRGGEEWQEVSLCPADFQNAAGDTLRTWQGIRSLRLSPSERLRTRRRGEGETRTVGGTWRGEPPRFRKLRWRVADTESSKD